MVVVICSCSFVYCVYLVLVPGQNEIFFDNFLPLDLSVVAGTAVDGAAAPSTPLFSSVPLVVGTLAAFDGFSGALDGVLQQIEQIFVFASLANVQYSHTHSKLGVFGGAPSAASTLSVADAVAACVVLGALSTCDFGTVFTTVVLVCTSVDTFFALPFDLDVCVSLETTFLFIFDGAGLDLGFQKSLELSSNDDCCCAIFSRIFA